MCEIIGVQRPQGVATEIVMLVRDVQLVLRPTGKGGRAEISSRSLLNTEFHCGGTKLTDAEFKAVMQAANGIFFGDRNKKKDPS